jgi:ParB family chromosome partitioning protein
MAKSKFGDIGLLMKAGEDAQLLDRGIPEKDTGGNIDGDSFEEIRVDSIENNPLQPRRTIEEEAVKELAASIDLHGLIQPIVVMKVSDQKHILLAGQRRLFAHKQLKREKIRAIVKEDERFKRVAAELTKGDRAAVTKMLFQISVTENELRESLTPLELALSIDEVLKIGAYKTISEIANTLGKSKAYISKIYSMLNLSEKIRDDLVENREVCHVELLYELQKIQDRSLQEKLYFEAKDGKVNIDDIRRYSVKKKNNTKKRQGEKAPYTFKFSKTSATLKIETKKLSEDKKKKLQEELEALAKKYNI